MIGLSLCVALAFGAGAPAKAKPKAKTSAAQRDAVKGAIAVDAPSGATADGGTAPAAADAPPREGPDVSKLPFSPDTVKTVVAYWQPKIQTCYEETLASKDSDVEGTLKTKWVVGPEGYVKKAEVLKKGTTLKDPHLHECVVTVLSSMTFPKTPNGKDQPIEFPFNLKATH